MPGHPYPPPLRIRAWPSWSSPIEFPCVTVTRATTMTTTHAIVNLSRRLASATNRFIVTVSRRHCPRPVPPVGTRARSLLDAAVVSGREPKTRAVWARRCVCAHSRPGRTLIITGVRYTRWHTHSVRARDDLNTRHS